MNDRILQLGRDHVEWGAYALATTMSGRTSAAASVGSQPDSPALASKGDPALPNEDAAFARDEGPRTLMAVADAHHGIGASHALIEAISALPIAATFEELAQQVSSLHLPAEPGLSASTLAVAIMDRDRREGFGISFGDSSLVRVGPSGAFVINVRRAQFISARGSGKIDPELGHGFQFFTDPSDLLVAFTDGVNECHYRSPETSITPPHLASIFASTGARAEPFARMLIEQALEGVDGHPGGQDNIALIVSSAGTEDPA